MAIYRQIYIKFWNDDAKISDEFTPEDKYFYLYLLTNPHTNLCGCYELSFRAASRETGYNEDTIKRLMERMEKVHHVIVFDQDTREVLIPNWHKYNWTKSKDLIKAVREQASFVKSESFKKFIMELIEEGTVMTPSQDGGGTSVHITATDTVTEKEGKSKRFVPPTVDEVRAYCQERKNGIDPQRFVDWYQARGWKNIKDWKACVRTWEKRNPEPEKEDNTFWEAVERMKNED